MKKLGIVLILAFLALVGIHFLLSPTPDEFVEEDLLEQIKSRGVLKVGINPDTKPFGFIDKNGKYMERIKTKI